MIKILSYMLVVIIANFSYAESLVEAKDIEFTSNIDKNFNKENEFGLHIKFNSLTESYTPNTTNATNTDTKARLTMFGVSYMYNGKDISFNTYASGGYTSETKDSNNTTITGGSAYTIDGGADLNYIIMNDTIFLSVGLSGVGYIGGIFVDNTSLKRGDVGVINTLGVGSRFAFYPLSELYFTAQVSMGFISLYSASLTGQGLPSYSLQTTDAEKPFQFLVNGKVYWRPSPNFSIGTGLGFNSTSYTDSASKAKYAFYNFYPFVCINFMF